MSAESPDDPGGRLEPELDPEPSPETPRVRSRTAAWGSFIPIVGMAVCAYLLAQSKDDVAYLFESSTPVDLGEPGAYHFERARPGAYGRVGGEVHSEGNRFVEGHTPGKIWPLVGAPLMIERASTEPLWGRVEAQGRLQMDDQLLAPFHKLIAMFLRTDELGLPGPGEHVWLLTQGRVPRAFDRTNAWLAALTLLFGINAWLVVRPVFRR
jgi:hypothetical protein